jgi:LDH2 family malate/lactate/ureidoglycolate dehydrogenase
MTAPQCIASERLVNFATAVYSALGVPDGEARLVADTLVQANLWGHQSHGVLRLSWYAKRIESGAMMSAAVAGSC